MGPTAVQQDFTFSVDDPGLLGAFLESLHDKATVEKRGDDFYIVAIAGICGVFVEAITGALGPVTVPDS